MREMASGPAAANAYEAYVRGLVSLHRDGPSYIDWVGLLNIPAPLPPDYTDHNERAARELAARYEPSTLERLSGQAKSRKVELERSIEQARAIDARIFEIAGLQFSSESNDWRAIQDVVPRIVKRDPNFYAEVLEHTGVLSTLTTYGTQIYVEVAAPELVTLAVIIQPEHAIPDDEIELTSWGNSRAKKLANEARWALIAGHAASCALRLAADGLQVLPVDEVIINLGTATLSSITGRMELRPILAIRCPRPTMQRLNLYDIDPIDSLLNFEHRMRRDGQHGFLPVEPMRPVPRLPSPVNAR